MTDFNFWMTIYFFGGLVTLYFGSIVKMKTGDEFSNLVIWITSLLWFIVIPPALFMVMFGEDE